MESNLKNNSPSPEVLPAPSPVTVPEPITLPEIDPDDPFNVPGPKVDPTPKGFVTFYLYTRTK